MTVALVLALTGCTGDESVAPPAPPGETASGRSVAAQRTLTGLVQALDDRDAGQAGELAAASARTLVATAVRNAAELRLTDLGMRLVDDQSPLTADDRTKYGPGAWAGTVELSYRLSGWDAQPTRLETRVVFSDDGDQQRVAGFGGGDARTPLWLAGPVSRWTAPRALVIGRSDAGERYLALARQALLAVGKVLPRWRGKLVIEAPKSERELERALAAPAGRYANIAAVTTTVDGSLVPDTPVHVFLNPDVFDDLGPRGSQVVVSHETTHVATDATFADVPTWLLEGFADYVALAHAGIPVETAASQILERIRKQGPPDGLPSAADLDPTANGLGATYEEAWLAARSIAEQYGEPKLVAFYRSASAGQSVAKAFRQVLGTTEQAFVKRWRAELRDLAGGVAG